MVIIGTGFAGLCMAIKLKEAGQRDFMLIERGGDVGGIGKNCSEHPGPILHVPSGNISRKDNPSLRS